MFNERFYYWRPQFKFQLVDFFVKQYAKTREEMLSMGITQLKLKFNSWDCTNVFTIVLRRPGLLIGRHGENIDALQKYLKEHVKVVENIKLAIEEDNITNWLIPYQPEMYDFY